MEHRKIRRKGGDREVDGLADAFECCLKPIPEAAREARQLVSVAWSHWELGDDYMARLVVSELVTNAIAASGKAGGDPAIKVVCRLSGSCPVIEVWDGSDELPEMRYPALGDLGGRGLPLVACLSGGWTVEKRPGKGKIVRVELGGAA
ncbi:ATP-binding protein [Actinomadura montaniterrae]|uniref:ATP-binding protein n=1 Tax=Actinomadura montaniterrae TaxID=1803903 RepID=A0A6L3VJQ7_9ACTN|nr:ATP-binding protein [Actinomadura montaniterrae]KAB2367180.1 ATP-binding protein [Actinomadura montaniterrae]